MDAVYFAGRFSMHPFFFFLSLFYFPFKILEELDVQNIFWKLTYLQKILYNKAFAFLLLIRLLINNEIALGTYVTVLSILRRICKH